MERFISGNKIAAFDSIIAAIAAFIAIKLLAWALSLTAQLLIFFGVYIVVMLAVDAALKNYSKQ